MSYMINLTNIIGEFPAWNLSTETRKNKYLEFEAPKRKFQRELNILNYTKCSCTVFITIEQPKLIRNIRV